MPLIKDHMVEAAFDYLNDAADAAAKARANRILAEHKRKKVLAELTVEAPGETEGRRRAWAESHDAYWAACEAEAEAVRMDEWHRQQRGKAEAVIEAWRTEQANHRGLSRIG